MTSTSRFLRIHIHFIVIVPLLIIAVTWPVFPNLFNGETFWLPSQGLDIYMKLWDAWYGTSLLGGKADFYFTDLLFHPRGLSLDFHNFSLPHMLIFGALQGVMPADAAYGLTHLLTIFANVLSAYVVLLAWFRNKWVALAGAVVFGMHPYVIHHSLHPDVISLSAIPLSFYAVHRGIKERQMVWLAVCAALLGFTTFVGMYIFVCLLILLGIYILWLAWTYWRGRWFWRYAALVFGLAAAISMIRVYPMLTNSQSLDEALDKSSAGYGSADVLEYVANLRHPHTGPLFSAIFSGLPIHHHSGHSYIGLIVLVVIGYALLASSCRRRLYPWLAALLFFSLMRLGPALIINGQGIEHIHLPGFYLTAWFPWIFKAFWDVEHYMIGLLFPSAVLFAYGVNQMAVRLAPQWRAVAILALLLLCAYERYLTPLPGLTIPQAKLDFIDWLAEEPNQEDIHLINLPMGRNNSKVYGFYQALNGYPQAEGLASRTLEAAYDYIEGNLLLRSWRRSKPARCLPTSNGDFQRDLQQLQADRFTHIILHHDMEGLHSLARTFDHAPAAYADDTVSIYRLDDLLSLCNSTALLNPRPQYRLPVLLDKSLAIPSQSVAVLSIHSFDLANGKLLDYYTALNHATGRLHPIRAEAVPAHKTPRSVSPEFTPAATLAANQIVIFAYDPRHTDRNLAAEYRRWVARDFKSCGRLVNRDELLLELFLLPDFPCDLIKGDKFNIVDYDSGFQLGNLILQHSEEALDLYFRWNRIPWEKHSISIQFFNAENDKVYNQDFVIRRKPLSYHRIDLAPLPPGEYQVKLILYNFETRASVPGEIIGSDTRFERELVFENLAVE